MRQEKIIEKKNHLNI